MKGRSLLVAVLVGGLLGITLVIGVLVVVQRARIGEPVLRTRSRGGVLVALVLPDATGSTAARVIVYYPPGTGAGKVVEPLTQVVVPGTSANTLRDAFTFGAGASLARAYGSLAGGRTPYWVVVDAGTWQRIAGRAVSITVPEPVDVFNGTDLVSFPAGRVAVSPTDLGILLSGTDGLPPSDRRVVLGDAAASLQDALASAAETGGVASDLSSRSLSAWLDSLKARSMPQTSTP